MPDQNPPVPQVPDEVAEQAIKNTRELMRALLERIFISQKKVGLWEGADDGDDDTPEDFPDLLLHAHAKLSSAFQAHVSGGSLVDGEGNAMDVSSIMLDTAIDLLGAARRYSKDAGSRMIDLVISHAREAEEIEKQQLDSLGDFTAELEADDTPST